MNIQFVILPNVEDNRTLLGADFLEQAVIVLNMGQGYWYFENDPSTHLNFPETLPLNLNLIESIKVANTSKTMGSHAVVPEHSESMKRKFEENVLDEPDVYHRKVYLSKILVQMYPATTPKGNDKVMIRLVYLKVNCITNHTKTQYSHPC